MRLALGVLLLLSGVAHADSPEEALSAAQLHLDPVRDILDETDHSTPYARASGFASLFGSDAGPGVSVGAAVKTVGLACDSVDASGHAHLQPTNDVPAEASADWHICLLRGALTVELGGRDRIGVAPAIDARASLWRRRYNEAYQDFTMGVGDVAFDDMARARHAIFLMTFGHGTTEQHDGDSTRRVVPLDVEFVAYRYRHLTPHPFTVETLILESNGVKAGDSNLGAVTGSFEPLRASFDEDGVFGAVRFGWTQSGGIATETGMTQVNGQTTSSWSETIDGRGLANLTRFIGELTLGGRNGAYEYSATGSRALYPTFDGDLALDERIAGHLAYARQKTALSLSPFVARTQTWRRDAAMQDATSYGASMTVTRDLTSVFRLDAIGQLAKSPYAQLEGDREPTNALGGQVLVALSAHIKR
ncbi:MAG TPA: hypothetical protein VGM90_19880 [Kofleriaceae bacterium]|jgi:hypothetical protein